MLQGIIVIEKTDIRAGLCRFSVETYANRNDELNNLRKEKNVSKKTIER